MVRTWRAEPAISRISTQQVADRASVVASLVANTSSMATQHLLLNRQMEISASERNLLEGAISQTQVFSAGHTVVRHGAPVNASTLLVRGFLTRHIYSPDGRRHVVAIHVPGDFVDLHAYLLKTLDHDVAALTDVTVAICKHVALDKAQELDRRLTKSLWFSTLLDAAMQRQWTYRLASLNARQRVAHLLCEMNARLLAIGLSDGASFVLPMTQLQIGEVCGLTNVYVSRVLRQLREERLCTMRPPLVEIHDLRALVAAGFFQPQYLYLEGKTATRAAGHVAET